MAYIDHAEFIDGEYVLFDAAGNILARGATIIDAVATLHPPVVRESYRERSAVPGVYQMPSGRWRVYIRHKHVGIFDTREQAESVAREKRA